MAAAPRSAGEAAAGRDGGLAQLILSIFGLYARHEGNWLSVASVVALMGDLDAEGLAVRSSISRLKRRAVLISARHDRAAGYALSDDAQELIAEGDVRIFERRRATEEDGWLLVVFSVPESERAMRHKLRSTLVRLGLGTTAPGVWIAPGSLAEETRHTLERRGLTDYVNLFQGAHLGFGDLRAKVRSWWDLEDLAALYAEFIERYRPELERVRAGDLSDRAAFRLYLPMLTQWRRLPYRDPGLPLPLLPPDWIGESAKELFDELDTSLRPVAERHALAVVGPVRELRTD